MMHTTKCIHLLVASFELYTLLYISLQLHHIFTEFSNKIQSIYERFYMVQDIVRLSVQHSPHFIE